MSTHTPGPWRWRSIKLDNGVSYCFLESAQPPEKVSCRDVTVLAVREDWVGTYADTSKAKYRRQFDRDLIAAAPDLLEALIPMVAHFSVGGTGGKPIGDMLAKARAAIAKATGS